MARSGVSCHPAVPGAVSCGQGSGDHRQRQSTAQGEQQWHRGRGGVLLAVKRALWASLIAQLVKNAPAMQETLVWFLGQEGPLERGWATHSSILGLPCGSAGEESACSAGDLGLIPGLGRCPGEGKGYHCSILAWRIPWTVENSIVHGVTKSRTWLSDLDFWGLPG